MRFARLVAVACALFAIPAFAAAQAPRQTCFVQVEDESDVALQTCADRASSALTGSGEFARASVDSRGSASVPCAVLC